MDEVEGATPRHEAARSDRAAEPVTDEGESVAAEGVGARRAASADEPHQSAAPGSTPQSAPTRTHWAAHGRGLLLGIIALLLVAVAVLSYLLARKPAGEATAPAPLPAARTLAEAKSDMGTACSLTGSAALSAAKIGPGGDVTETQKQVVEAHRSADAAARFAQAPPMYHLITDALSTTTRARTASELRLQLGSVQQLCRQLPQ